MTTKTTTPKEVAIKKVVVQLSGSELILSVEEAKKLQAVLNDLFKEVIVEKAPEVAKETIIKEHHYHEKQLVPYYPQPYYYWNYPAVTYTVSGGMTGITCTSGTSYTLNGTNGVVNCSTSLSSGNFGSISASLPAPKQDDDGAGGGVLR